MIKEYKFYAAKGYLWSNPKGRGVTNSFTLEGNGQVVRDLSTGLFWQQSGSESVTYSEVQDYIEGLNRQQFSGYDNWRLPTLEEAMTLMEPDKKSNNLHIDSLFDTKQDAIWTSDKRDGAFAWVVAFTSGRCILARTKEEEKFVRAAR